MRTFASDAMDVNNGALRYGIMGVVWREKQTRVGSGVIANSRMLLDLHHFRPYANDIDAAHCVASGSPSRKLQK